MNRNPAQRNPSGSSSRSPTNGDAHTFWSYAKLRSSNLLNLDTSMFTLKPGEKIHCTCNDSVYYCTCLILMCLRNAKNVLAYGSLIINYQVDYLMKIEFFFYDGWIYIISLVKNDKTCSWHNLNACKLVQCLSLSLFITDVRPIYVFTLLKIRLFNCGFVSINITVLAAIGRHFKIIIHLLRMILCHLFRKKWNTRKRALFYYC